MSTGSARCAELDSELAEMALGTLTGKSRVATLVHLEGCARCSARVEELSAAADQLLQLAPHAEPPVGFEARVFQRLGLVGADRARGDRRPRLRGRLSALPRRDRCGVALALAAGAVVVAAAFGAGLLAGRPAAAPRAGYDAFGAERAALVAAGHPVGEVVVYPGDPTWLFMEMNAPGWDGALRCEVTIAGGRPIVLGQFWLTGGRGAWSDSVPEPTGRLREAKVVDAGGRVLAVATMP
jgi:anti-sigma factor RsiW